MIIDNKRFNYIRDNYPVTFKWMKAMAKKHNITVGAVLNRFECEIKELMIEENEFK